MTMQPERPGVDWNDGAGEPPIGTFMCRLDVRVGDKPGKEALFVTLNFIEALGETPPLQPNPAELEMAFWLGDLCATKKDGSENKYVKNKRKAFRAFVTATGQEMPDLSNFGDLSSLKAFAEAIQDSTVTARTYRGGNDGKTYADFAARA